MAFHGVDLLDLYRVGSGLTLRKVSALIDALPPEAPLWVVLRAEQEKQKKATPDEIRERQRAWQERNAQRLAKEAGDD